MEKLKIALVAPLTRPTEPDTRGSRPKIVYDLAKFLTEEGHEVTVFAPGDSKVPCELVKVVDQSVYLAPVAENPFYQHAIALTHLVKAIKEQGNEFDIIHNHSYPEFLPLLVADELKTPILTTPHLYIWNEYGEILSEFPKTYFAPIAEYQKKMAPKVNWLDVVYNGIAVDDFEFNDKPKDYFLFFGRIKNIIVDGKETDPKGFIDAIEVCKRAGVKLVIAGNVEDPKLYDKYIKPHLGKHLEFIGPVQQAGPIGFDEKVELYKNAKGFFFLSHWDEGCPLGPMESMACGTPVIANDRSSLKEIIKDGETGFIVEENDIEGAVEAVKAIDKIDRKKCREHVEQNFTSKRMVDDYIERYKEVIKRHHG
jgi:glycosyltransferase involved in cell wall biosynthesis